MLLASIFPLESFDAMVKMQKKKKIKATKHHSANRTVQPLVFYGQHVSFTNLKTAAVCVQG